MGGVIRLLIVDDSERDAAVAVRELRRGGFDTTHHRVDTAAALRAALDGEPWDVIISDFHMPELTGHEALRIVRERSRDVPFIVLSGVIGEELAVELLKAGADDYVLKDRSFRLCLAVDRALRDAGERVSRRRIEEALRASEERFRTLVDSMDDLVFTVGCSGKVDGFYGRAPDVPGAPSRALGVSVPELFGAEHGALHEQALERAFRGEPALYECSTESPRGARHYSVRLSARRSLSGEVVGLVGVAHDVTAQKEVQAQLAAADRMASVGLLAAGVAHEINGPLSVVLANAHVALETIREGAGIAPPLEAELLDIQECAHRVRRIVRDLGLFSRSPEDHVGPVDVRQVLDVTLRLTEHQMRHRARLVKDYGEVALVVANDARLGQVFLNLIMNAIQAIPEERTDESEVRLSTRTSPDGSVVVEVKDTGAGMSEAVLGRLFTPFFTTKPVGFGTGLGLSICHRIVTGMGGIIVAESKTGEGSTFRVTLPAAPHVPTPAAPAVEAAAPATRRGRILLIDDEPQVLSVLARILGRHHDTVTLTRGADALELLRKGETFDLVFCDLMMPGLSGMALYDELGRVSPEHQSRVVFLTGGAFTPEARAFLDQVPNLRLEKPFDVRRITELAADRVNARSAPKPRSEE